VKNVLIVDDEKPFLMSLTDGLSAYAGEFKTITAENGQKAVDVLKSAKIDLVVTDLKMPRMDGFELLAHMSHHHPDVPAIVMTAFGTPQIEDRLRAMGTVQYIEKPLNLNELAARILEELAANSEGYIHGITLPTFLQLLEMEKKTCTLTIKTSDKVGYLYFNQGELVDGQAGDIRGLQAANEIAAWENAKIEISSTCRKRKNVINRTLSHVLMEAFRLKDEKERGGDGVDLKRKTEEDDLAIRPKETEQITLTKEEVMALEAHLQALKEIKGYKAAGIMNFTGEMLASDSTDASIDLGIVGATFNDIFRSAHEASKKIGLEACRETAIATPKGVIVMRCSGVDAKAHFHLIGIMSADGNQALMKMQIEKLVPAIMAELA